MKKNIVTLRGISKIAKVKGLYVKAAKINDNTYVTGQGIIPGRKETISNLTLNEMTGKVPLSEEKAKKFPFIINPFEIYSFPDGKKFDMDVYQDRAFVEMIKLCGVRVADSKTAIIRGRHDFYLENKDVENTVAITRFNIMVEAGTIINDLNSEELFDMISYLGVAKGDSSLLVDMSPTAARAALIKYAETKPEYIIEANKEENKIWIQVAKLVSSNVLKLRGAEFYEGNAFVASDFDSLVNLYRTDSQKKIRWDKKFKSLSHKTTGMDFNDTEFIPEVDKVKEDIEAYQNALLSLKLSDATTYREQLKSSKDKRAEQALSRSEVLFNSLVMASQDKVKSVPNENGAKSVSREDKAFAEIEELFDVALANGVIEKKGNWFKINGKNYGTGKSKAILSLMEEYKNDISKVKDLLVVKTNKGII